MGTPAKTQKYSNTRAPKLKDIYEHQQIQEKNEPDSTKTPCLPNRPSLLSSLMASSVNSLALSSSTWVADQSAPWFGKVVMPSRPAVSFSEPPTPSPPPQVPSAATTPSTSVATSATAPTASRTPRRRSLSGSRRVRFNRGSLLNTTGFTRSRFLIFWIELIWI